MTLKEFNNYMDKQFNLLIKKLCPKQKEKSKNEKEN